MHAGFSLSHCDSTNKQDSPILPCFTNMSTGHGASLDSLSQCASCELRLDSSHTQLVWPRLRARSSMELRPPPSPPEDPPRRLQHRTHAQHLNSGILGCMIAVVLCKLQRLHFWKQDACAWVLPASSAAHGLLCIFWHAGKEAVHSRSCVWLSPVCVDTAQKVGQVKVGF